MMRRIVLLCGLATASTASAQMIPGLSTMMMDVQHRGIMAQVMTHSDEEVEATRNQGRTQGRSALTASATSAAVTSTYTPSLMRRRANLARFAEQSRAVDPQGAAAMKKLFAGTDVIAAMDRALRPVGLRVDDVADAYAVWWVSVWSATHGDTGTPSRTVAQAVRAQSLRAISATPEFTRADDAAKQEYAEAMLVQAAMIDAMMEQFGADSAMASNLAASVRQGAQSSGLDLDAMTLTEQGFVPATIGAD